VEIANRGVTQGCGRYPLCFIVCMNTIIKEWRQNHMVL